MYRHISVFSQEVTSKSWQESSTEFLPECPKIHHLEKKSNETTGKECNTIWGCHWAVSHL